MSKKRGLKKKINFRILLPVCAAICFFAALIFYFLTSLNTTEREYAVYSAMEEPTLPVVYAEVGDYLVNGMHGHIQDMGNAEASDFITPLSENRRLKLNIRYNETSVVGLSYEIRSLDLSEFIEKTVVDELRRDADGIHAELPIQNMIKRNTPYLLKIQLDLGERVVNYYTRIVWTDNDNMEKMAAFAADFNAKTFHYDSARELTSYLEVDPAADQSSLAHVGIGSGFSQITWGSTGMEPDGAPEINIREADGIMGAIELCYASTAANESEGIDRFINKDEYTLRIGNDRMYLMNFDRQTRQRFAGSKHLFSGRRISLGITAQEDIQTKKSENGQYIAFKDNKDLWAYDQSGKRAVSIFSFRSAEPDVRSDYDEHDIKILNVDDNGDVDFVVYGYINRGRHEGYNGIIYYRYEREKDSIMECFFLPTTNNFDRIQSELSELCVRSSSKMFYLKQNDAVAAIDLTSLEMVDISSGLIEGRYAISHDQTKIAWMDRNEASSDIRMMDVMTGITQTLQADEDAVMKILFFYDNDLVYGLSRSEDVRLINGREAGLPMYELRIVNAKLEQVMTYRKEDIYLDNVTLTGDRIHLEQYKKTNQIGGYNYYSKDTIVNSNGISKDESYLSTGVSETRKKIYFVDLDENIKTTKSLKITSPDSISYENSGNIELGSKRAEQGVRFYAYANGRLIGSSSSFKDALDWCYEDMGWITDEYGRVVYNRVDRQSIRTISNPEETAEILIREAENFTGSERLKDGELLIDARGTELNQLLYYVYKGSPILARTPGGGYCLIYGYNNSILKICYLSENGSHTDDLSRERADEYFGTAQNDFVCFVH